MTVHDKSPKFSRTFGNFIDTRESLSNNLTCSGRHTEARDDFRQIRRIYARRHVSALIKFGQRHILLGPE